MRCRYHKLSNAASVSQTSSTTPICLSCKQITMLHGAQSVKVKPVEYTVRRLVRVNNMRNWSHCSRVIAFESKGQLLIKFNVAKLTQNIF